MEILIRDTTLDKVILPETVYKYRDWNDPNHKRMITEREIFYAAPLICQKQYEINLPMDYSILTDELVYKYYYQFPPHEAKISHLQRHYIALQMLRKKPFNDLQHRANVEKLFREKLNKTISIFCTSPFKDNYCLWNNFADNHTGFCIGFDTNELKKEEELIGSCSNVSYYPTGKPPMIKPLHFNDDERTIDMMKVVHSLPDIYIEEKEYRFAKSNLKEKQIQLPDKCFKELILGSSMPVQDKLDLIKLAKKSMPNCIILEAKTNTITEEINFVRLNV